GKGMLDRRGPLAYRRRTGRPVRLAVRTPASHVGNRGSIPLRGAQNAHNRLIYLMSSEGWETVESHPLADAHLLGQRARAPMRGVGRLLLGGAPHDRQPHLVADALLAGARAFALSFL